MTANIHTDKLRLFIERIESIEEEMDGHKSDRKDVYAELKAEGYDAKAVRKVIRLRKMDKDDRDHEDMMEETYRAALGL